jgi:hypothetical protein
MHACRAEDLRRGSCTACGVRQGKLNNFRTLSASCVHVGSLKDWVGRLLENGEKTRPNLTKSAALHPIASSCWLVQAQQHWYAAACASVPMRVCTLLRSMLNHHYGFPDPAVTSCIQVSKCMQVLNTNTYPELQVQVTLTEIGCLLTADCIHHRCPQLLQHHNRCLSQSHLLHAGAPHQVWAHHK